jgi:hypothetical protein
MDGLYNLGVGITLVSNQGLTYAALLCSIQSFLYSHSMDLTRLKNHMDLEIVKKQNNEVIYILQSFDWLAAFHLELLLAILFTAV